MSQQNDSFEQGKAFFQSIKRQERVNYLNQMLKTKQIQGKPKIFKKEYAGSGKFSYKNWKINYYYEQPHSDPEAVLFFFHGMNAHGGSSGYLGVNIAKNASINVYAIDFLNFGQSKGDLDGYIDSIDDMVRQAQTFIEHIMEKFSRNPKIFISGLSLGGAITFKLCLKNPDKYSGALLFSPALREVTSDRYYLKKIGKILGSFFPRYTLLSQNNNNATKYDLSEEIKKDLYNYNGSNVLGSVKIVLTVMEQISKQFQKLKTPYILIQSGVDKLVDVFAPLDLEQQCQSKDKTTIYFKDMWHSIFYEQQIEKIWPICVKWIQERI